PGVDKRGGLVLGGGGVKVVGKEQQRAGAGRDKLDRGGTHGGEALGESKRGGGGVEEVEGRGGARDAGVGLLVGKGEEGALAHTEEGAGCGSRGADVLKPGKAAACPDIEEGAGGQAASKILVVGHRQKQLGPHPAHADGARVVDSNALHGAEQAAVV